MEKHVEFECTICFKNPKKLKYSLIQYKKNYFILITFTLRYIKFKTINWFFAKIVNHVFTLYLTIIFFQQNYKIRFSVKIKDHVFC